MIGQVRKTRSTLKNERKEYMMRGDIEGEGLGGKRRLKTVN